MKIKIGINGMGRIGRMIVRSIFENNNTNIEIKHYNRTSSQLAQNFKINSIHGKFHAEVGCDKKSNYQQKKISFESRNRFE